MKLSTVIKELQRRIEANGDVNVLSFSVRREGGNFGSCLVSLTRKLQND